MRQRGLVGIVEDAGREDRASTPCEANNSIRSRVDRAAPLDGSTYPWPDAKRILVTSKVDLGKRAGAPLTRTRVTDRCDILA